MRYSYICNKCNTEFTDDKPHQMSEEMSDCPNCKSKKDVRKTWKPIPIFFRGDKKGWTKDHIV